MIEKLFPKNLDNQYDGLKIAKWAFVAMTILTIARSFAHILLPDGGAQSIATIALNDFSTEASSAIIGIFSYWGWSQLLFGLFFVIVLWRYQSLIPLMWLFIFTEWVGRYLLETFYKPIETIGTAPGKVGNMIFPFISLVMLILALQHKKIKEKVNWKNKLIHK